jgi:hypothetical protein
MALQLAKHNQTQFLVEYMQPDWLSSHQQHLAYHALVSITVGSAIALLVIPFSFFLAASNTELIAEITTAFIVATALGWIHKSTIRPVERLKWGEVKGALRTLLGTGFTLGIAELGRHVVQRVLERLRLPQFVTDTLGWIGQPVSSFGLSVLTAVGWTVRQLFSVLNAPYANITKTRIPNEGIKRSGYFALALCVSLGVFGLIIGLFIDIFVNVAQCFPEEVEQASISCIFSWDHIAGLSIRKGVAPNGANLSPSA